MKLIFVYNAKGGFWSKKIGAIHKIVSPSSYGCDLCKLTHGSFVEKDAWKVFRETSAIDMEFYYKEGFIEKFPEMKEIELPSVIFECISESSEEMLTADDLKEIGAVSELIKVIETRLQKM